MKEQKNIALKTIAPILLIGAKEPTTLRNLQDPAKIWRFFKPLVKHIEAYEQNRFYSTFRASAPLAGPGFMDIPIERWAAVKGQHEEQSLPDGLAYSQIEGGLYATYTYQGRAADFNKSLENFREQYLASSGYEWDWSRAQFETFDSNYDPLNEQSTEEIWIPIIKK
ncbi:effector binding domain-containing protein [Persicobacter psychrovividus]|uniref:Integron-associated effector binding protein domain-containing protein n=1 Tax=Persicobacter psychrovividus TaxID=387638 RepID=A0ABN6LEK7_9BACT|nr:hypothetical protein PEPS_38800 [Persicobacter psychrovividus]